MRACSFFITKNRGSACPLPRAYNKVVCPVSYTHLDVYKRQDQQFYTYTQMSKAYVGVTRNDKLRFVVADGQEFGSIAQSKGN